MKYLKLKKRIKNNEGFSIKPYKDQLGFYTIGYGHFIKKNEGFYFNKKYKKKHFEELFEKDFNMAINAYFSFFKKKKFDKKTKYLLVEMIFQMGIKKVLCFKKMLNNIDKKNYYLVALEMMDSLWFKQTPKRVEEMIYNYIKNDN